MIPVVLVISLSNVHDATLSAVATCSRQMAYKNDNIVFIRGCGTCNDHESNLKLLYTGLNI